MMPDDMPAGKHAAEGCAPASSPMSESGPAVEGQHMVSPCHQVGFT